MNSKMNRISPWLQFRGISGSIAIPAGILVRIDIENAVQPAIQTQTFKHRSASFPPDLNGGLRLTEWNDTPVAGCGDVRYSQ
jgi:hypothetical protein